MNRFICTVCALTFAVSSTLSAFALQPQSEVPRVLTPPIWLQPDMLIDNENLPVAKDNDMWEENDMGMIETYGSLQKFTNKVDGYSIMIPANMTVDMSISDVCTTFSNSSITLKLFKETFETESQRQSYILYSRKFIENTTNHTLEEDTVLTSGNREYHILQWSRKKLSKIKNDKNYYACVDVCEGARVYTFQFTSDAPFSQYGGYIGIVDSLITFDPSVPAANAYNSGYKGTDIAHLNKTARSTYNKLFSDDTSFNLGIFSPEQYGGYETMSEFEEKIGYSFPVFLIYTEVIDKYGISAQEYTVKINNYYKRIESYFEYAQAHGKSIELTLQPPLNRDTGSNMVYEILDGEYDQFLNGYAKTIAKYPNVTVLFRPFNEMNGDWCSYSSFHTSRDTEIYKHLFRYMYDKLKDAGCSNAISVWNPNERSFPNFKWNNESLYYPGDEYVDVYGITGYNNGTYYSSEIWRSFDEIYTPIYERAERINEKPIMITEFSCSSIGGDKVAWLEDMFLSLPKYDKIKLGIWWHAADYDGDQMSRPYFMDTPDGMLDVFNKYMNME